ncbi:MAG: hypothetical protein A3G33_02290 [Omnitrophica bacterium RIFCSPLOWO2_12_FULL_44_17]|uniref:Coenzyme Q-binding protein COQ10 START domain-containing protein n=1 Tax=Candidatus Danuiimicrobium aquiferis TaxID=1801832 RepID=A0A1G1L1V3_9BACT|nr:MAG: hypothetical protein A3B72_01870 [Omnitrophica bacterium RIFCSPHIGHO2_02_FULL_45_28]OGW90337.1 MAG: hypothetical protein A3E74_01340 [Omnitrophica bacterium RIFCSPHIGHO2_12_FULL_44_12]OGW98869.1 MAG: hypothetical protein A3G33_02290 [Omnitrophica bacterium RIFCSPLOWO2_12_FULL_44_17]OGX01998.1 MAG: hypothetical protein A3J12_11275 [Omnitrophica bacterium RIFCSPLOWO2_02_FULL_44_11]
MSDISLRIIKILPEEPWKVLLYLMQTGEFASLMPNVKHCKVIERGPKHAITEWKVEIDQILLTWKERSEFDFNHFRIAFKSVEGDLPKFDGYWSLVAHPLGTQVELDIEADIRIPLISQVIGPVLTETIRKNFNLMLEMLNRKIITEKYTDFKEGQESKIGGFAIIGHPYNLDNLIRYLQFLNPGFVPPSREFLSKMLEMVPSYEMTLIKKFVSTAGVETHGLVIMSTFIPEMANVDPELVFRKVVEACHVAENYRIGIVALGGFTSIVGERFGDELKKHVHVPLTTGNTYTVAVALDGVRKACELMEINLSEATVAVLGGGTGDIGGACARILSEEVKEVIVTGRFPEKVALQVERFKHLGLKNVRGFTDNLEACRNAEIVIAATSATESILTEEVFKSGAVICDLAYPKNISYSAGKRDDVFIFSGGLAEIPEEVNLGFEIGLPASRILYGCLSEAILLDLEKRYESFSYGKGNITREKVDEIKAIADKHGFHLAPFYSGKRMLSTEDIEKIKQASRVKMAK